MRKTLVRFDWAMKKLLRSKANFGILEGFLSELLKQDLKIVQLLESEGYKEDKDGKQNRVDMLVQLESGEVVLIEVQVNTESDYFYRMLTGTSKIVTEYLKEGDPYSKIKKIVSVNILYFDLGHGKDYLYHGATNFVGLHAHDTLDLNDKQKTLYKREFAHQLFSEYYLIKVNQFNDVAKDTLDEWIYFLKNEEIKDNFHAKGLAEVKEKLIELKLSEPEKQEYKRYLDNLHYQASMVESGYDVGKLDGKIEGKAEGRAEGERVGLEKGKAEIAKKMKQSGMAIAMIETLTGLSVDEIKKR